MIIDDNLTDRYIAEHYLKAVRFAANVISKSSAREALGYLKANSAEKLPKIIFLDIRMPEMDGFEFLDEYAKLPALVNEYCTVIMLSSSNDPKDHERIKANALIKKFIDKPINKESLMNL
jgi:CheY-like chemotaxis protein